jgi:hypothetical protein
VKLVTCKLRQLEARARAVGTTLDAVSGCITKRDGDVIVVDFDHPLYPNPPGQAKDERPATEWPLAVQLIAKLKRPGDKGVGDTLARAFNLIPVYRGMGAGEAFKALMAQIGVDCRCNSRREWLNQNYPYAHA